MRVLAIETTETAGSVSAACDSKLLLEIKLDPGCGSAKSLAPGLKSLLDQVGWRPQDVELVAVALGPGSFTGLRVGIATAKTFAYCVKADILGVDTLEVIAAGVPGDIPRLSVAMDAQRGQVIARLFRRSPESCFVPIGPAGLLDNLTWLGQLAEGTSVAGPVLRRLVDQVPPHVRVLDRQYWFPSATAVSALAVQRYRAGLRGDIWSLVPHYCRRSAAEEKWDARQRASEGAQDNE